MIVSVDALLADVAMECFVIEWALAFGAEHPVYIEQGHGLFLSRLPQQQNVEGEDYELVDAFEK